MMMMMMMIAVVIMRQRTVMKGMKAMVVIRTAVAPMTKIEAVDADDTDDADGRYCDILGFFRVTYYKEAFISVFQEALRSG